MGSNVKLYLAPFQGITGVVFREIYSKYFPWLDKLYTPFFTSIYKQKSLDAKGIEISKTEHKGIGVVPQILSKDADEIIRFSQYCHDRGYTEINWNLGCPYPRVANKKRGSGMLPYPEIIDEILSKSIPELKTGLSIKCRLGYFSPDEIYQVIPVFNDYDISEIIIHARIGKQLYKGDVLPDHFQEAQKRLKHPVVYNGDIFTRTDFLKLSKQWPEISAWMIGRGLLRNPFLPGDIKEIPLTDDTDRKEIVKQFVTDLYIAHRKNKNDSLNTLGTMKEYWSYLSFSFNKPVKVFNSIKKTRTFDSYDDAVNHIFKNYHWNGSKGF